jgi:hypothetical protein
MEQCCSHWNQKGKGTMLYTLDVYSIVPLPLRSNVHSIVPLPLCPNVYSIVPLPFCPNVYSIAPLPFEQCCTHWNTKDNGTMLCTLEQKK